MLSSAELLDLIYELPERSRFKTQAEPPFGRAGQWPEWMQMLKHLTNETSLNRASKCAGGENEYGPTLYMDPIERVEYHEQEVAEEQEFGDATAEFDAELGWT